MADSQPQTTTTNADEKHGEEEEQKKNKSVKNNADLEHNLASDPRSKGHHCMDFILAVHSLAKCVDIQFVDESSAIQSFLKEQRIEEEEEGTDRDSRLSSTVQFVYGDSERSNIDIKSEPITVLLRNPVFGPLLARHIANFVHAANSIYTVNDVSEWASLTHALITHVDIHRNTLTSNASMFATWASASDQIDDSTDVKSLDANHLEDPAGYGFHDFRVPSPNIAYAAFSEVMSRMRFIREKGIQLMRVAQTSDILEHSKAFVRERGRGLLSEEVVMCNTPYVDPVWFAILSDVEAIVIALQTYANSRISLGDSKVFQLMPQYEKRVHEQTGKVPTTVISDNTVLKKVVANRFVASWTRLPVELPVVSNQYEEAGNIVEPLTDDQKKKAVIALLKSTFPDRPTPKHLVDHDGSPIVSHDEEMRKLNGRVNEFWKKSAESLQKDASSIGDLTHLVLLSSNLDQESKTRKKIESMFLLYVCVFDVLGYVITYDIAILMAGVLNNHNYEDSKVFVRSHEHNHAGENKLVEACLVIQNAWHYQCLTFGKLLVEDERISRTQKLSTLDYPNPEKVNRSVATVLEHLNADLLNFGLFLPRAPTKPGWVQFASQLGYKNSSSMIDRIFGSTLELDSARKYQAHHVHFEAFIEVVTNRARLEQTIARTRSENPKPPGDPSTEILTTEYYAKIFMPKLVSKFKDWTLKRDKQEQRLLAEANSKRSQMTLARFDSILRRGFKASSSSPSPLPHELSEKMQKSAISLANIGRLIGKNLLLTSDDELLQELFGNSDDGQTHEQEARFKAAQLRDKNMRFMDMYERKRSATGIEESIKYISRTVEELETDVAKSLEAQQWDNHNVHDTNHPANVLMNAYEYLTAEEDEEEVKDESETSIDPKSIIRKSPTFAMKCAVLFTLRFIVERLIVGVNHTAAVFAEHQKGRITAGTDRVELCRSIEVVNPVGWSDLFIPSALHRLLLATGKANSIPDFLKASISQCFRNIELLASYGSSTLARLSDETDHNERGAYRIYDRRKMDFPIIPSCALGCWIPGKDQDPREMFQDGDALSTQSNGVVCLSTLLEQHSDEDEFDGRCVFAVRVVPALLPNGDGSNGTDVDLSVVAYSLRKDWFMDFLVVTTSKQMAPDGKLNRKYIDLIVSHMNNVRVKSERGEFIPKCVFDTSEGTASTQQSDYNAASELLRAKMFDYPAFVVRKEPLLGRRTSSFGTNSLDGADSMEIFHRLDRDRPEVFAGPISFRECFQLERKSVATRLDLEHAFSANRLMPAVYAPRRLSGQPQPILDKHDSFLVMTDKHRVDSMHMVSLFTKNDRPPSVHAYVNCCDSPLSIASKSNNPQYVVNCVTQMSSFFARFSQPPVRTNRAKDKYPSSSSERQLARMAGTTGHASEFVMASQTTDYIRKLCREYRNFEEVMEPTSFTFFSVENPVRNIAKKDGNDQLGRSTYFDPLRITGVMQNSKRVATNFDVETDTPVSVIYSSLDSTYTSQSICFMYSDLRDVGSMMMHDLTRSLVMSPRVEFGSTDVKLMPTSGFIPVAGCVYSWSLSKSMRVSFGSGRQAYTPTDALRFRRIHGFSKDPNDIVSWCMHRSRTHVVVDEYFPNIPKTIISNAALTGIDSGKAVTTHSAMPIESNKALLQSSITVDAGVLHQLKSRLRLINSAADVVRTCEASRKRGMIGGGGGGSDEDVARKIELFGDVAVDVAAEETVTQNMKDTVAFAAEFSAKNITMDDIEAQQRMNNHIVLLRTAFGGDIHDVINPKSDACLISESAIIFAFQNMKPSKAIIERMKKQVQGGNGLAKRIGRLMRERLVWGDALLRVIHDDGSTFQEIAHKGVPIEYTRVVVRNARHMLSVTRGLTMTKSPMALALSTFRTFLAAGYSGAYVYCYKSTIDGKTDAERRNQIVEIMKLDSISMKKIAAVRTALLITFDRIAKTSTQQSDKSSKQRKKTKKQNRVSDITTELMKKLNSAMAMTTFIAQESSKQIDAHIKAITEFIAEFMDKSTLTKHDFDVNTSLDILRELDAIMDLSDGTMESCYQPSSTFKLEKKQQNRERDRVRFMTPFRYSTSANPEPSFYARLMQVMEELDDVVNDGEGEFESRISEGIYPEKTVKIIAEMSTIKNFADPEVAQEVARYLEQLHEEWEITEAALESRAKHMKVAYNADPMMALTTAQHVTEFDSFDSNYRISEMLMSPYSRSEFAKCYHASTFVKTIQSLFAMAINRHIEVEYFDPDASRDNFFDNIAGHNFFRAVDGDYHCSNWKSMLKNIIFTVSDIKNFKRVEKELIHAEHADSAAAADSGKHQQHTVPKKKNPDVKSLIKTRNGKGKHRKQQQRPPNHAGSPIVPSTSRAISLCSSISRSERVNSELHPQFLGTHNSSSSGGEQHRRVRPKAIREELFTGEPERVMLDGSHDVVSTIDVIPCAPRPHERGYKVFQSSSESATERKKQELVSVDKLRGIFLLSLTESNNNENTDDQNWAHWMQKWVTNVVRNTAGESVLAELRENESVLKVLPLLRKLSETRPTRSDRGVMIPTGAPKFGGEPSQNTWDDSDDEFDYDAAPESWEEFFAQNAADSHGQPERVSRWRRRVKELREALRRHKHADDMSEKITNSFHAFVTILSEEPIIREIHEHELELKMLHSRAKKRQREHDKATQELKKLETATIEFESIPGEYIDALIKSSKYPPVQEEVVENYMNKLITDANETIIQTESELKEIQEKIANHKQQLKESEQRLSDLRNSEKIGTDTITKHLHEGIANGSGFTSQTADGIHAYMISLHEYLNHVEHVALSSTWEILGKVGNGTTPWWLPIAPDSERDVINAHAGGVTASSCMIMQHGDGTIVVAASCPLRVQTENGEWNREPDLEYPNNNTHNGNNED